VIRFFLDRNANGRFDAGEEPVSGATIRLDRPVNLEPAGPGVVRAIDLPAYQRFAASVDVSGVRNPLWIPKFQLFAFIADPNRYKAIDVPFFVGGVLEGSVVRRVGEEERAVAGLKVHLKGVNVDYHVDLPTFSDGTFYQMGVPPGRYTLEVDAAQLSLLGVRAEPDFVLVPTVRPQSGPAGAPGG